MATGQSAVRVAQVSPYGMTVSGITQVIHELSRLLARQGFRMTLWSPGRGVPEGSLEPVEIQLRAGIGRNAELAIRTFGGLVRHRSRFEIIHCHQVHPQTIAALAAAKILGKASVLTCHVRPPETGPLARLAGGLRARIATSLASRLVTVSDRIRSDFPGRRWTTIPNGVSVSDANSPDPLPEKGPRDGSLDLVFTGRLTGTKGIFTLLEAMALARDRLPGVRLVTFGPSDSPTEYAKAKRRLGIDDIVVDRGYNSSWRSEIRPGQAFVLPSEYEGLPQSMLEAMSAGLPAIGTPVGGVPDVVIPYQTGLLVPVGDPRGLADAIVWMGGHRKERLAMGENARKLIRESFRADGMAERYAQLYREIQAR